MEKRRGPKRNGGSPRAKARRVANLTDDSEKPVGQWNRMVIECCRRCGQSLGQRQSGQSRHSCTAKKGQIALQAEGSEVEFRDWS